MKATRGRGNDLVYVKNDRNIWIIRSQAPKSVMQGYGEGSETRWFSVINDEVALGNSLRYSPAYIEKYRRETPSRSTATHFRRKTARGWSHFSGLQYSKGVYATLSSKTSWWLLIEL